MVVSLFSAWFDHGERVLRFARVPKDDLIARATPIWLLAATRAVWSISRVKWPMFGVMVELGEEVKSLGGIEDVKHQLGWSSQ